MININWKSSSLGGFIYEMEYIETRDHGYLVNFIGYDSNKNIQKCIVELTSDEIQIIRKYPDITFDYIYNDKNGKNYYMIEFEYDASDKSIDDILEDFCGRGSFSHSIKKINTLSDLISWRFQPRIEYGTNGCVVNHNKVRKLVCAYIEPNKISDWINENEWDIMREAITWSTENLEVFRKAKKETEENACSDTTSTNNSENTSEKSE